MSEKLYRKVVENGEVSRIEFTEAEYAEYAAARAAHEAALPRKQALSEIQRLESQITPRRLREAVLTEEGATWLAAQEALIATERNKLTGE